MEEQVKVTKTEKKELILLTPERRAFFKEYGYLLFCMLIPAILMYLIYLSRDIHPFGNGSVLVLDLNGQYVYFFEALRDFVKGDASLLYSFSRALGGEFLGIYAYYLASPFSYIVCLFPKEQMLEALLALFLLKTAICGGTFGFYMHKTLKDRKPFAVIAFSIFYALSSYAVVQQHNTMWIDAVMWLPLITLGIEQLIKHGKYKMYTITLAVTLLSNFYIGFMVCFYCFFYFFFYYFAHNEKRRNNPHRESNHFFKSLFRIALYSMIAIGIAAVILLSAYYALNFGKTTFSNPKWDWKMKFDLMDLFYKFLPGSYDTVRPAGLPFVYCGVLTLLLLPAYFLSQKHSMRQKIFSALFILLFVASMSLSVLDLFWHGFQNPNWLNYRYSFMLCFYLCVLACRTFADFEAVSLKSMLATAGLLGVLCLVLQNYTSGDYVRPDDFYTIWFTLIMIFVYLCVLGLLRKTTEKQILSTVLLAAISIEAFLNGLLNLNALDDDVTYSKYDKYNGYLNKTRPIVEMVQESDDSFYRMEKTFFRKTNDNMALGIRGLSGSTSTLNKETIQFLNKMGYASKSHWSKYLGGTPLNDSLLGLKYIISTNNNPTLSKYYEVYKTDPVNKYTAYYNPYALSLAYGVDEDILDFPLGYLPVIEDENSTDKKDESAIANAIKAVKGKLNGWFGIDETVNSAEYEDEYDSPFERLNAMVTAMLGEERTVKVFVPIRIKDEQTTNLNRSISLGHNYYTPINKDADAVLTYSIIMPETAELFFYMPSDHHYEAKLTLEKNGSATGKGTFGGNETTRIISLGQQTEGSQLYLNMTLNKNKLYPMVGEHYFYYIDWEVFEDVMARLAKDQFQINEYTESSFSGTFTTSREHELVMTTIPYDKGWRVTVDGKEVETVKALGSLVSFYIDGDAGETHTLELVYKPNTFYIGLTATLVCSGLLILIIIFEKKLKKIPYLRVLVGVPYDEEKEKAELLAKAEQQSSGPPEKESENAKENTEESEEKVTDQEEKTETTSKEATDSEKKRNRRGIEGCRRPKQ